MDVIKGDLSQLEPLSQGMVLTLGNFDGVHRGHQYLISQVVEKAKSRQLKSGVLCFEPHPQKLLEGDRFTNLMTLETKIQVLAPLGLDYLVVQNFTEEFSQVSPRDFIHHYLEAFFQLEQLSIGYDFRFGQKGQGDVTMIREHFSGQGVEVISEKPFYLEGEAPSSSLIRQCLSKGQVERACKTLGRPYELSGKVVRGLAKGRTIGFPTVNLSEIQVLIPGDGVYIAHLFTGEDRHQAVVNIGCRPTLSGKNSKPGGPYFGFRGGPLRPNFENLFFKKTSG